MKISELTPNPKNPRKVTDQKLEMLKAALLEFGDLSGIVFNRTTNQLVGGHQRIKHIDPKGSVTIVRQFKKPTRTGTMAEGYVELQGERFNYREVKWPKHKEMAANIAANKGAGDWDLPQLGEWMKELGSFDVDLDLNLTMFDKDELKEFGMITVAEHTRVGATGVDEDEVPIKAPARTHLGAVYELGDHRLMCGDSTSANQVNILLQGRKAEMLFTDPPYGVDYQGGHNEKKRERLVNDDSTEIYTRVMPVIAGAVDGPCYTWFAGTKSRAVVEAIEAIGVISAMLIWHKTNATYGAMNAQYKQRHEPFFYWKPKTSTLRWCGLSTESTLWEMKRDGQNKFHPTQKPVELAERAILNHKAETVLDLFGGSGSTLIACEKTGRKCFMMELDPSYCDVIVERWEKYMGQKAKLLNPQKMPVQTKLRKAPVKKTEKQSINSYEKNSSPA